MPPAVASLSFLSISVATGYSLTSITSEVDGRHIGAPYVRVVKRRTTANKKERRRTQSINNAYADLRDCIPNLPADTKMSKVRCHSVKLLTTRSLKLFHGDQSQGKNKNLLMKEINILLIFEPSAVYEG